MCRIAGIFDPSSKDLEGSILLMRDSMQRGGPDDQGIYLDENLSLALGHRRLSLIDLSKAGHQPMQDPLNLIALVFNGEIYNFKEIKKTLTSLGHNFITQTDTEVIIYAYLQWGIDCFSKFNGMFAVALWDRRTKQLVLARDHAGIKPLYFHIGKNKLIFASEIRAFKSLDPAWPENNEWRIPFLMFGHLPEPFTTLKDVQPLEKGSCMVIDLPSLNVHKHIFNRFIFTNTITTLHEAITLVKEKLESAVQRHLISDAPIGLFLSGGIDSSLLTLIAQKYIGKNLQTLSIIFDDSTLSEEPYQKIIIDKTKANHKSFLVTEKDFEKELPDILHAMDQPSTDAINSYFISKYAKEYGLTAVLSGIGADELFGGYGSFHRAPIAANIQRLPSWALSVANTAPQKFKKITFLKKQGHIGEYLFNRGLYTTKQTVTLLSISEKEVNRVLDKVRIENLTNNKSNRNRASHLETNLYMQNQLLKDIDYMSMWHSLEVRVPFLDKELMQAVYSIAPQIKFNSKTNKYLLIKAFDDLLPREIWQRKKQGFTFPFYKWMKNVQPLKRNVQYRQIRYLFENNKLHWSRYWAYVLCINTNSINVFSPGVKKVLFVNLAAFSSTGGIEKFNRCLLKALADIEIKGEIIVDAASLHDTTSDEKYFDNENYRSFGGNKVRFVSFIIQDTNIYDIIIAGHINLASPLLVAKLLDKGKKIILIAHGIEVWSPLRGTKKAFLNKVDMVLAVSNYTKQKIIKNQSVSSNKIQIFHNTIDPYFKYPEHFEKPQYLKERYSLNGKKIISTLTRLSSKEQYKGYDKVLQILPELKKTFPDIKYLISGKADKIEKQRVQKLIKSLGLEENVVLTGYIKDEEIIDHYLLSDTFIMPSTMEGFGIVFIEAMACGVAVIAGNVDGSVDALNNGEFGKLINPSNNEEIIRSLVSTEPIQDVNDRLLLQKKIKDHFGFKSFTNKLEHVISNIPIQNLVRHETSLTANQFINDYHTIKKNQSLTIRSSVRKITLDTIGLFDDFKNEQAFKKNRIQFLYVHHIFKDEENKLRELIEFLWEDHVFINYSDAIEKILKNEIDKPYICFSSDDGFKNNLTGAKILEEYGIKACFFICPGIIGDNDYNHIKHFCAEKLEIPPVEFLNWNDVDTLLMNGHEIGSHTMDHSNLVLASGGKLREEIGRSYDILRNKCGIIQHFAYPYGRYFHINESVRQMVFATGYQSCTSAERGCHINQDQPPLKEELLIRRDHILLNWNIHHIKYFMRRNSFKSSLQQNKFPFHIS